MADRSLRLDRRRFVLRPQWLPHRRAAPRVPFEPPSFGLWQQLVYYPTYARLDSLVIGVGLAALQIDRPALWNGLASQAWWIWLPALAAIVLSNILGEHNFSMSACALQFPLLA